MRRREVIVMVCQRGDRLVAMRAAARPGAADRGAGSGSIMTLYAGRIAELAKKNKLPAISMAPRKRTHKPDQAL
jgi:hypothetical protein